MILKKTKILFTSALVASALLVGQPLSTTAQTSQPVAASKPAVSTYTVDGTHSTVAFSIIHSGVSKVIGTFGSIEGELHFHPENLEGSKINITVNPGSVNTNSKGRDGHLQQSDYFNVEKYATSTFVSKSISHISDNNYKVMGDLTLLGNTKPLEFTFTYNGEVEDKWGNTRIGGDTMFSIDRTKWGLSEGVGTLSKDVTLMISLAATKN